MKMILFSSKVRCRKRAYRVVGSGGNLFSIPLDLVILLQFLIAVMVVCVSGGDVGSASDSSISSLTSFNLAVNLGTFLVIYSAFPHLSTTKSIRNGKEVEDSITFLNASLTSPSQNQSSAESISKIFSSRTLQTSEENSTLTPSEEMDKNVDSDSSADAEDEEEDDSTDANIKEYRKKRKKEKKSERKEKGFNRLKRQMGLAAEIAVLAPALQTMGCIPKFFCGMNSKQPNEETSALNDLAYLIKFAMLDDDDVELDDPLFEGGGNGKRPRPNNRGKDGLNRIKEDLIIENMAEEELIQEDPANLPFVMQDMDSRIKTKTKPGNKLRWDDELLDAIIVEPEQTAMGSLFTGIKSVFRLGRSSDTVFNNQSSQVTPRSGRSTRSASGESVGRTRSGRWQRRFKKQPFWRTPQFRQDMELAERIGKVEQDDGKCSSTFNVCPYTVHEMMDIVHGGYRRRQNKKRKKKPQWYVNAQGPPHESSEESSHKPFKDPDNLVTTTTPRTKFFVNDPEQQIYYAMFPHKAIERGITTIPTTKRPKVTTTTAGEPELEYDPILGIREKQQRRPPVDIQGHVEYENANDEEGSMESRRPEHIDIRLNNKKNNHRFRKPGGNPFWRGNKRPQHMENGNDMHILRPGNGGRPPMMGSHGDNGNSDDKDGEDEEQSSEEGDRRKKGKKKKKGEGDASESVEDEEGSSEEKDKVVTPAPPEEPAPSKPPIQIQGMGGFAAIQESVGQQQQQQTGFTFNQDFQVYQPKQPPIAATLPKYKIQNIKPKKKQVKRPKLPMVPKSATAPPPPPSQPVRQKQKQEEESKKDDKSIEDASDEEEQEESQENSSEERPNKIASPRPNAPPPPPPMRRPPNFPMRGRPSEEIREHLHNQHRQNQLMQQFNHNNNNNNPNNNENDGDNSDEEARNSHSAPVDGFSNEMGGPHMRNTSNEYTYSDEAQAQGPHPLRPINYSYFKKGSREVPNGPMHGGPPQQRPQETPPPSTTQKYSTGFLGFLFGKNKKKRGSYENSQQRPPLQYPTESREDEEDDDDAANDDDDDDDSQERNKSPKETITGPDGKYEVGHLRPPPKSIKPNFQPPKKPDRPYRGATSMEDSDEKHKRGRGTPSPQTTQQPESLRPLLFIGKPHRIVIPPPATPPPPTTTPSPTLPYSTRKPDPKDSEEQDNRDSDEDKQSDESKEDDDSKENSSEEKVEKAKKGITTTKTKAPTTSHQHQNNQITIPPLANLGSILPENVLAISGPVEISDPARIPSTTSRPPPIRTAPPTKEQNTDYKNSEEKQGDDSNQTKEDDSEEETNRSDENSDEDKDSSEEVGGKKDKRPPPPKRKPEDDELEHPSAQYPPLPPVGGDIAAVEEILSPADGQDTGDDEVDEALAGFGLEDNIPAAPPLALQGFPSALEIVVPTRAPPIRIPPAPLNNNPNGAASNNFGGIVANQAGGGGNSGQQPGGGTRDPAEQFQQGLRNPGSSSSNRGPSGNRQPGQQQQNQNKKNKKGNKEDGKKKKEDENSSEEKNSSEENKNNSEGGEDSSEENNNNAFGNSAFDGFPTNEFDEAILSLGFNEDDDENGGAQGDATGNPPAPPPIFQGSGHKQQLHKNRPFLPRPVTPQTPVFYRPRPSAGLNRNDPILMNQLPPHQQHQQHMQQQQQNQKVPVFAFRPSAAAVLRPVKRPPPQQQSSSNSFLVSHLLRPFMRQPAQAPNTRKPLDPKVVQWIRETYGIPDLGGGDDDKNPNNNGNRHPQLPSPMQLHGPNRAGLGSSPGEDSQTSSTPPPSSSGKKKKIKVKVKSKSNQKKPTKTKSPSSSEKESATSKESISKVATTTTSTTAPPTSTSSMTNIFKEIFKVPPPLTASTTTTVSPSQSTSHIPQEEDDFELFTSSLKPLIISSFNKKPSTSSTTSTSTSTTTTTTTSTTSPPTSSSSTASTSTTTKLPPDYITSDEESKMAQALFSSEEVSSEEESNDGSDDSDDTNESIKSQVKTKVGNHKLIITVKSVANSTKSESKRKSAIEKMRPVKSKSKSKTTSASELRKKLNIKISSSSEKLKPSSSERKKVYSSSKEKLLKSTSSSEKKHSKSSSSEKKHSKSSSSERDNKRNPTSSPGKKGTKARPTSSSTYSPKNTVTVNSRPVSTPKPKPKPIKLPPIYGKPKKILKRRG